jgi:hypothetical protein
MPATIHYANNFSTKAGNQFKRNHKKNILRIILWRFGPFSGHGFGNVGVARLLGSYEVM